MMDDFKTVVMNQRMYNYLLGFAEPPTAVQCKLIERTRALGESAEMQIPHEQAVFLNLLVKLTGARTVVEVGTYTGYSTLAFAMALPDDGRIITCDMSRDWTQIAQKAWAEAGVAERVNLLLGRASVTLADLPEAPFIDIVFIDADKVSYIDYWEHLVPRMRPGGLLLADNVLYYGEASEERPVGNAAAIDAFNHHARNDDRVESVMLPVADGLLMARRKP
jgi:caffeoyl-CoA O-methyltransferase